MIEWLEQPGDNRLSRATSRYRLLMTSATGEAFGGRPLRMSLRMPEQFVEGGPVFKLSLTTPDGVITEVIFSASSTVRDAQNFTPYYSPNTPIPHASFVDLGSYLAAIVVPIINRYPLFAPFLVASTEGHSDGTFSLIVGLKQGLAGIWQIGLHSLGFSDVEEISEAVLPDRRPVNARVKYSVFFERNFGVGNFESVYDGVLIPNTEGVCLLPNLSDILDSQCVATGCGASFSVFSSPQTPRTGNNMRHYWVRFTEEYGDVVTAHQHLDTTVKNVLLGGMSRADHTDNFFGLLLSLRTGVLSFAPNSRSVGIGTPLFFNFINTVQAAAQVSIHVSEYTDGVVWNTQYLPQAGFLALYETSVLPIDTISLNISDQTDRYAVAIVNTNDHAVLYARAQTYYVERVVSTEERVLAWRNPFGMWETVRVSGSHAVGSGVDRKEAIINSKHVAYNAEWKPTFTYRAVKLSAAEREWLAEIMVGSLIYEIFTDGYVPFYVTDTKIPESPVDDNLTHLDIKVVPVDVDMSFSTGSLVALQDWATWTGKEAARRFMIAF